MNRKSKKRLFLELKLILVMSSENEQVDIILDHAIIRCILHSPVFYLESFI